ncbi:MAG: uncharacterized protein QOJ65_2116 [Fimbriimonadaceae bacterium]|nr:uncharacterized protein [Fimbriimonadaceae bacterium]
MRWTVDLPGGEVPVLADDEVKPTVVILAHGAGSHMEHKTMEWLAGLVRGADATVVRFNFLYRAQARSMPDRMPVCVETYRAVIASVREKLAPERLIIGGHSFGGRVASMLEAEGKSADGLLLFGYPLHPPGQPEKLRDKHLSSIKTPTLQINGTRDELCTKQIMDGTVATLDPKIWMLHWVEGADHSYSVKKTSGKTRGDVAAEMGAVLASWIGSPFKS